MIRTFIAVCMIFGLPASALGDSLARNAGKVIGEFGAGIGEQVGQSLTKSMASMQPEWITIMPRSKEECLVEAGGELNAIFMRCRNGRQEYVRYDANGKKMVLNERSIPSR